MLTWVVHATSVTPGGAPWPAESLSRREEDEFTRAVWQAAFVSILIDEARWWHRGEKWCHLVSDVSYDELHEFADVVGIPRSGFHGDHYDIPASYRAQMISAGATAVESRELLRRLRSAGLRLSPAQRRAHKAEPTPTAQD